VLARALETARGAVAAGERAAARVAEIVRREVAREPLVALEYVGAVAADSFRPVDPLAGEIVVPVAARVGSIRLLDNFRLRVD
jgi:pantoate--beta-alanine ligase